MKKTLFIFLLVTGASCADDSKEDQPIVCTFTFADELYEATEAACGFYYGGNHEMDLRNGNEDDFELFISMYDGPTGTVTLLMDGNRYTYAGSDINLGSNSFNVDVEMEMSGVPAGRLVCNCACSKGSM